VLTGTSHVAVCVPDVDEAVRWYVDVLGLTLLSPPYEMRGEAIEKDMGDLVPAPVAVKAAMVGVEASDHVIEVIGYPEAPSSVAPRGAVTDPGFSHFGFICDDLEATRRELESRGVEFLVPEIADIARLRTTWLRDPWGNVFILLEKRRPDRPYWDQYS
jgi:catechol 2,3-dioxygenase-like lactoylglutathione lyase family enzyme